MIFSAHSIREENKYWFNRGYSSFHIGLSTTVPPVHNDFCLSTDGSPGLFNLRFKQAFSPESMRVSHWDVGFDQRATNDKTQLLQPPR